MLNGREERERLERKLPALKRQSYEITSPADDTYNCLAWANGDDQRWWSPDVVGIAPYAQFWPEQVPRGRALSSFIALFEAVGYAACESTALDRGYEKVVLYQRRGNFSHVVLQRSDGKWTSKCGAWQDVVHDSADVFEGEPYGLIGAVMRRPRT